MEEAAILNRFITSARRIEKAEKYIHAQLRAIASSQSSDSAAFREKNLLVSFEEMRFACVADLAHFGNKLR